MACAMTDGRSKETSRHARVSDVSAGRDSPGIPLGFDRDTCCRRSHGTHLRETSRALLLGHLERPRIAAPNAPGARQARTGRHPAGHPRCDGPGRANAKYGVPENRGGRIGKSQLGFQGKSQLSQDGKRFISDDQDFNETKHANDQKTMRAMYVMRNHNLTTPP